MKTRIILALVGTLVCAAGLFAAVSSFGTRRNPPGVTATSLDIGDRVKIVGHPEWPDGTTGIVSPPDPFQLKLAGPGEWSGHRRTTMGRKGPIVFFYVRFDHPTDVGSGDGPYSGAEVAAEYLQRVRTEVALAVPTASQTHPTLAAPGSRLTPRLPPRLTAGRRGGRVGFNFAERRLRRAGRVDGRGMCRILGNSIPRRDATS